MTAYYNEIDPFAAAWITAYMEVGTHTKEESQ